MPAPATVAAGIALGGRGALPRALAAAGLTLLGLLLLIVAPLALLASLAGSGPTVAPSGIPQAYLAVYREPARVFGLDWLVLAAVHEQETGFSSDPATYDGLNAAGCCAGPFQLNVTNLTDNDHPIWGRNGASGAYTTVAANAYLNGNPRNGLPYFNTGLFATAVLGTPGSASRRTIHGPGMLNFDISLMKSFKFTETKALQLRWETFNTFNHAQFFGPSAVNGDFDNPLFGQVVKAASPRVMQLAAKFTF